MANDLKSPSLGGEDPDELKAWWRVQLDAVEHVLSVPSAERVAWLRSRERELRMDREAPEYRATAVLLAPAPSNGRTGSEFDAWLDKRRADLEALLETRE